MKKPGSQQYQGLAMPKKAITPPSPCKVGLSQILCRSLHFYFAINNGEYSVVPVNMVHKIPEQMSWEQAALVEPTAVGVHAVRQSTLKIGDTVAVFGTGPIGLLVIQAARAAGASKIIATEVSPERQEFAKKIGADIVINPLENDVVNEIKRHTDGLGVDVSFEVAGVNSTLNTAIQSTKREGNVVNISIWENTTNIPLNKCE